MYKENKILTELPVWETERNNGKVNWGATVGMELSLLYEESVYKVKVIKYKNKRIWVDYNGYIYEKGIDVKGFYKGQFGNVLKLRTNEFKYEVGKQFKDDKRDMIITDREYRKRKSKTGIINEKWYKYTCNKCGWTEGWIEESVLKREVGCSCCSGHTVVPNINSIKAKAPWMIKLGVGEEDAVKYTPKSNQKIKVICPYCGKNKFISPNYIYRNKSICCSCSDKTSYPEKFMNSVLTQLGIDFETQLTKSTFKWCGDKRYDFYIPLLNMIIETHGIQHYEESPRGRSLAKEQENDKLKKQLALNNGVNTYIELDCRCSDMDFIKNSILNSKLNGVFDLSNIDWNKCEEFALKNIAKEVCDYWKTKEEWETTTDLETIFGLRREVIVRYLKRGNLLRWCTYNSDEERVKGRYKAIKIKNKQVEIFKDDISLGVFESIAELERQSEKLFGVKLGSGAISKTCKGTYTYYKGYTFKYAL